MCWLNTLKIYLFLNNRTKNKGSLGRKNSMPYSSIIFCYFAQNFRFKDKNLFSLKYTMINFSKRILSSVAEKEINRALRRGDQERVSYWARMCKPQCWVLLDGHSRYSLLPLYAKAIKATLD